MVENSRGPLNIGPFPRVRIGRACLATSLPVVKSQIQEAPNLSSMNIDDDIRDLPSASKLRRVSIGPRQRMMTYLNS